MPPGSSCAGGLNLAPKFLNRRHSLPRYSRPRIVGRVPFRGEIANSVHGPQFLAPVVPAQHRAGPRPARRRMLFSEAATCSWTSYFHDAYAPSSTGP